MKVNFGGAKAERNIVGSSLLYPEKCSKGNIRLNLW